MNLVKNEDIAELLRFVLQTEKRIYKENPFPSSSEKREKEREYRNKIEELSQKIAIREGVRYEN